MHRCIHTHVTLIFASLKASTTLQMQDLASVMLFWYHTVVCDITLLSGVVLIKGSVLYIAFVYTLTQVLNRPESEKELYNLRHASARNVVERAFGVLKKKWGILTRPPQFSMSIQARIPPAMCALHNFLLSHDPTDVDHYLTGNDEDDADPNPGQTQDNDFGVLAAAAVTAEEKTRAEENRDRISKEMWDDYQRVLCEREQM